MRLKGLLVTASAVLLGSCASASVTQAAFVPMTGTRYAIDPPGDAHASAALPLVDRELRRLGWTPDPAAPVRIVLGASERGRLVGAYFPSDCTATQWAARPLPKRLLGGGQVASLSIIFVDRASGRTLYRSDASVRGTWRDRHTADRLAVAALRQDPRGVAPTAAEACRP